MQRIIWWFHQSRHVPGASATLRPFSPPVASLNDDPALVIPDIARSTVAILPSERCQAPTMRSITAGAGLSPMYQMAIWVET